jgi:DNA-binding transcriptional MerR regulator/methylmalonyl-CoA mutase cobalamin-binding subunit
MRIVTRRTGLSADLLRAWEKRHEVVTPDRSSAGRRLYSDADIERLRLLYRATLAGRGIGQVAGLTTAELSALVKHDGEAEMHASGNGAASPVATAADEYLGDALRAVARMDVLALEVLLRRAVVALPAVSLLDGVVAPLLARLGTGWREGTLRPVHGHLASTVLRRVLDRLIETATAPGAAPNLVVGTPVGQVHEFGALLAAATAAAEGWRVTYLGTSLPAEDIAEAATVTRARAVALSVVYPASDPAVGHELRRLRTLLPKEIAIIAGGAASPSYRAALDETGARLVDSVAELQSELRALRHTRSSARPGLALRKRARSRRSA